MYTKLPLTTFPRIILFNPYNPSMPGGGKLFSVKTQVVNILDFADQGAKLRLLGRHLYNKTKKFLQNLY